MFLYFYRFDINSPDSGIHSDARSDDGSHVQGAVTEDTDTLANKSSGDSEETTPTGVTLQSARPPPTSQCHCLRAYHKMFADFFNRQF